MLRGPFLAVALLVLVVVLALGRVPAGTPTAAPSAAAGFSPLVPPRAYIWGDCRIRVGPGYDAARAGRADWRVLGAGRIDCARRHGRLVIAVRELRAGDGPPAVVAVRADAAGGAASTGLVETGPACRDAAAARWQTQVLVTVDGRSSGWLGGDWSVAHGGCGPN